MISVHEIPFIFFFDSASVNQKKQDSESLLKSKDDGLRCANCKSVITHGENIISVHGSHEHTFTNPLEITFHIGCFSDAAGCICTGEETLDHTWFPEFAWRTVTCFNCKYHLGWRFSSPEQQFYGLILSRLTSNK